MNGHNLVSCRLASQSRARTGRVKLDSWIASGRSAGDPPAWREAPQNAREQGVGPTVLRRWRAVPAGRRRSVERSNSHALRARPIQQQAMRFDLQLDSLRRKLNL